MAKRSSSQPQLTPNTGKYTRKEETPPSSAPTRTTKSQFPSCPLFQAYSIQDNKIEFFLPVNGKLSCGEPNCKKYFIDKSWHVAKREFIDHLQTAHGHSFKWQSHNCKICGRALGDNKLKGHKCFYKTNFWKPITSSFVSGGTLQTTATSTATTNTQKDIPQPISGKIQREDGTTQDVIVQVNYDKDGNATATVSPIKQTTNQESATNALTSLKIPPTDKQNPANAQKTSQDAPNKNSQGAPTQPENNLGSTQPSDCNQDTGNTTTDPKSETDLLVDLPVETSESLHATEKQSEVIQYCKRPSTTPKNH